MMTAQELVRQCSDVAENYKTLYVMGCFGAPLTGKNVDRYLNNHKYNRRPERQKMIRAAGNQAPPVYGFDCVCLIKGVLWGWNGDPSKSYGGAAYASNGVPDVSADGMIKKCRGVTADFSGIVPGAAVWMPGHIGVYIGGGLAVECSPKWANRVQITAVGNLGKKAGYNTRTWTKWGLMPYVDYSTKEDETVTYEQWKEYMDRYLAERAKLPPSGWAADAVRKAVEMGITADGARPGSFVTREEAFTMAENTVTAARRG